MSNKRQRRRLDFRWIYGAPNEPIAIAEEQCDGTWRVSICGQAVGVFVSEAAARDFVQKVRAVPTPSPAKEEPG